MRLCRGCKQPFKNANRSIRYCSTECLQAHSGYWFICPTCSGKFWAEDRKRKYCSYRCKGAKNPRRYPKIFGLTAQQARQLFGNVPGHGTAQREWLVNYLGGKCVACSYDKDIRALALDHKNGDGKKDRELLGSRIFTFYCQNPEVAKKKLQVLCYNCNHLKMLDCEENNSSQRLKLRFPVQAVLARAYKKLSPEGRLGVIAAASDPITPHYKLYQTEGDN